MPDIFAENQINKQEAAVTVAKQLSILNPVHLFTTFTKNPRGISFAEQEDGEEIVLFLRRDFITNVPWIIAAVALSIIPFLIRFIFVSTGFSLFSLPHHISIVLLTFYYLIVLGFAFANLVTWFYNIGLITTKRGVDIDFTELTTINVSTASLPDIKDVEYTQSGFFQSLFDYGDIRVRIVASGEVFTFEKVPRPTDVAGVISNLIGGRQP
jgi:hypothetical protein